MFAEPAVVTYNLNVVRLFCRLSAPDMFSVIYFANEQRNNNLFFSPEYTYSYTAALKRNLQNMCKCNNKCISTYL